MQKVSLKSTIHNSVLLTVLIEPIQCYSCDMKRDGEICANQLRSQNRIPNIKTCPTECVKWIRRSTQGSLCFQVTLLSCFSAPQICCSLYLLELLLFFRQEAYRMQECWVKVMLTMKLVNARVLS